MKVTNYHISFTFSEDTGDIFKKTGYSETFFKFNHDLTIEDVQFIRETIKKNNLGGKGDVVIIGINKLNTYDESDDEWNKMVA